MSGRRNQSRGRQSGQGQYKQSGSHNDYGTGAGRSVGNFQSENSERSDFQDIYSGDNQSDDRFQGRNQSGDRYQRRNQYDQDLYSQSSRILSAGSERPFGSWESEDEGNAYSPRNNAESQRYRSASESYGISSGQGRWGSQNQNSSYGMNSDQGRSESQYSGGMRGMDDQYSGRNSQQFLQSPNRGESQWPSNQWSGGQDSSSQWSGGSSPMGSQSSIDRMSNSRGMGQSGRAPKGYQRSDDRIKEDVCESIIDLPHIDASEIEVKVERGEVTLTGTVDNRNAKRIAEDAAEQVRGVKDVTNQIRVQSPQDRPTAQTHTLKSQTGSSRSEAKQA